MLNHYWQDKRDIYVKDSICQFQRTDLEELSIYFPLEIRDLLR